MMTKKLLHSNKHGELLCKLKIIFVLFYRPVMEGEAKVNYSNKFTHRMV